MAPNIINLLLLYMLHFANIYKALVLIETEEVKAEMPEDIPQSSKFDATLSQIFRINHLLNKITECYTTGQVDFIVVLLRRVYIEIECDCKADEKEALKGLQTTMWDAYNRWKSADEDDKEDIYADVDSAMYNFEVKLRQITSRLGLLNAKRGLDEFDFA